MKAFLRQVAEHYCSEGLQDGYCFVLPNRRAVVFFRKYLKECAAGMRRPMLMPELYTMNDFFYRLTGAAPAGQVALLLELYECYRELNPSHETLDEFIFWGGVLLSDFNDVDKYLVRPESLFANVAEFRGMQDGYEYLDERQLEAINRFVSHFRTGGRYKDEFRKIWDILLPLYRSFGERLRSKGLSYEGQVYRELAERLRNSPAADVVAEGFPDVGKFVFVGLNALNECEKLLMRRLRNAGMAEFCWDYGSEMIRDPHNRSSFFMSANLEEFPQAFELDADGLCEPQVNVLSIPSATGQAKQLPAIFRELGAHGIETAVVLPDEKLLLPVLNSIPREIADINVTMGCPMNSGGLWSLMNNVSALQMHLREKDGKWYFYRESVRAIFADSVFRAVSADEDREAAAAIRKDAGYYIGEEQLQSTELFRLVFRAVAKKPAEADAEAVSMLQDYQMEMVKFLAGRLLGSEDMAVELDFAREYCRLVESLRSFRLELMPASYFRLLNSLAAAISVPFRGEPLNGLQIMGPLETRALDFDNLVILSCNEGVFPRRNVASSFIPPELRRGFGLPTYEYQDAVWAYYFYRMIQRASRVWLLFDSRTEGVNSGEESRYIRQLELVYGLKLRRFVAKAPITGRAADAEIPKTEDDVRTIRGATLSASTLKDYLNCPVKFYYHCVRGLAKPDEAGDALDSGQIGSVFHQAMQELYTVEGGVLTAPYLKSLLKGDRIKEKVRSLIMDKLNTFEVAGKNLIYEDMIRRYALQVVRRDIELLDSLGKDSLRILGLEHRRRMKIGGFSFVGFIDRLDSLTPGELRIVDYKTGRVSDDDFLIDEGNAEKVVEKLFGNDNGKRPNIALQLYLYDRLLTEGVPADGKGISPEAASGKRIVNSIYQTSRLFVKPVESVELNPLFNSLMAGRLDALLGELSDTSVPFRRTEDTRTCEMCDFKTICGR